MTRNTTKALHRFIGSIAFVGAPRIALAVIEDGENDRRLLLHAKNNLATAPLGLAYRIKEKLVGEPGRLVTAPYVVWEPDHVTVTANEALAADASAGNDTTASSEAEEFLRELLADDPVPAKQVKAECEGAGLSWATVRRAKGRLGIRPHKEKGKDHGGWLWALPTSGPTIQHEHLEHLEHLAPTETREDAQDAHSFNVSTFIPDEHLQHLDEFPDLPAFLNRRARP